MVVFSKGRVVLLGTSSNELLALVDQVGGHVVVAYKLLESQQVETAGSEAAVNEGVGWSVRERARVRAGEPSLTPTGKPRPQWLQLTNDKTKLHNRLRSCWEKR